MMQDISFKEMIRFNTDTYYMQQLRTAIELYKERRYPEVNFIRAELRSANLLLFYQGWWDIEEFSNAEMFVINMLGGKSR